MHAQFKPRRMATAPTWPRPRKRVVRAIAALPLWAAGMSCNLALAIDNTWLGSNGDWSVAANWSAASVPGSGDTVLLNSGTATLSVAATIAALQLGGGAVAGTGDLSISGASGWSGGAFSGAASTSFAQALDITGAATKVLVGGRVLNLAGITTWSGNTAANNNAIRFWNGATINNTGTFVDANDHASFIEHNVGGPHNFNNSGTYNKQSATITTVDIGVAFNSTGTVNVNAGIFRPSGGTSSGSFNIAQDALLDFRNGNNTLNNVTISGAGTFEVSSDNVGADALVTLNGGTLGTRFVLSGSTLAGSDHSFLGTVAWTGGSISGAAVTTFTKDVTISGAATKTLVGGRVLNLEATTTWSGNTGNNNNAIQFWNGATINNKGTFIDANGFDSFIEHSVGGPHNFNNLGTYVKQSNTITTIDLGLAFNNSGTVQLNAGTFRPTGGVSSGSFVIAGGATLDFRNGSHTLDNASTGGAGTFLVSTDNVGADGVVSVNGGTHTTALRITGSVLAGSHHSFQGPVTWTGGAISGNASTTFTNDVSITGPATKVLVGGRVLNLQGTTTWSGNTGHNNNAIRFWNGATINNQGTFVDANAFNSFLEHNTGGPHAFNNVGVYEKQSATLTTVDLGLAFNNTGTVNLRAGTLQLVSAHTNQGLVNVYAGATLLGSNATFANTGTLAGEGTVATHANGDVVNQGLVTPGFGIGRLTVDGDLRQLAAGSQQFELASLASFDQLAVTDDVILAGSIVAANAGYVPVVGDSFVVLTFDQRLSNTTFDSVGTLGYGPGVSFAAIYNPHDVTLVVVAVPEVQTYAMLLAGLGWLGVQFRRRGRSRR